MDKPAGLRAFGNSQAAAAATKVLAANQGLYNGFLAAGLVWGLSLGAAGTYSVLQPELAYQLRDRKLANLGEMKPETIVSANIGCITHLQSGTATPVRHWVEVLDEALLNS